MRRQVLIGVAVLVATVAAGCIPAPPSGWKPSVITVEVGADPIVAGEPFTVDVTAVDKAAVTWIDVELTPPTGSSSTSRVFWSCEGGAFVADLTSTRSFSCVLDEDAPNGNWRLQANAGSGTAPGYQGTVQVPVIVTGGSDDHSAPALVSVEIAPNPVVIGQPFAVTIRAVEEHPAPAVPVAVGANIVLPAPPGGTVSWSCSPVVPTADGTNLEWRFTDCLIPEGSSPWTYAGGITVEDALGYRARLSFSFQAVAA